MVGHPCFARICLLIVLVCWVGSSTNAMAQTAAVPAQEAAVADSSTIWLTNIGEAVQAAVPLWSLPVALGIGILLTALLFIGLRRRKIAQQVTCDALFENSPIPALSCDHRLRIQRSNAAAGALLGRATRLLRGHYLPNVIALNDDGAWPENEQETVTVYGQIADVPESRLELLCTPQSWGRKRGLLVQMRNLTERDQHVQKFKSFQRALLTHAPLDVAVLTPEGRYIYSNAQDEQRAMFGASVVGKTDVEWCSLAGWSPEVAVRRRAYRLKAATERVPVAFEEQFEDEGEEVQIVLRQYYPIVDEDGEVSVVVSYGSDVTAQKTMQQVVTDAKAEAAKMERIKDVFLQNISHEFRTPLTGIMGFAEILKLEVQEDLREFAELVEQSGRRLMNTLNAMLELAGLEAETMQFVPHVIAVHDEVDKAIKQLQHEASKKELFLKRAASADTGHAYVDQASLQRVLYNVIENAIKFTHEGGIIVEVNRHATAIEVQVIDTGIGVQEAFIPGMFDAFNQESYGDSRAFEGMGLGLAISKRLVERMGGTIHVVSRKEEGTAFSIILPNAFPGNLEQAKEKPLLLLVDQSPDALKLMRYHLGTAIDIVPVQTAAAASQQVQERPFDAVMLAVEFNGPGSTKPLIDGLRRGMGQRTIPIIATDASLLPIGVEHYRSLGFDAMIPKPFQRHDLLNGLAEAFRRVEHGSTVAA